MKFFTPELIERLNSTETAVADAAQEEWENALARYEEYCKSIEPGLPQHIREFNNLLLHDAIVWSIVRRDNELLMSLRKDIPPQDVVILTYFLTEEPYLNKEAFPPGQRSPVMDFLYDEFELLPDKEYSQCFLFGNGWEMRLRFRDVQVNLGSPVYPVPDTVLVPVASAIAKSA